MEEKLSAEEMETEDFVLVRKKKEYRQVQQFPKISIDLGTYRKLQKAAIDSGLSISQIAKQAIDYAFNRVQWVEE